MITAILSLLLSPNSGAKWDSIVSIAKGGPGTVYVAARPEGEECLYEVNLNQRTLKSIVPPEGFQSSLARSPTLGLVVATSEGIFARRPGTGPTGSILFQQIAKGTVYLLSENASAAVISSNSKTTRYGVLRGKEYAMYQTAQNIDLVAESEVDRSALMLLIKIDKSRKMTNMFLTIPKDRVAYRPSLPALFSNKRIQGIASISERMAVIISVEGKGSMMNLLDLQNGKVIDRIFIRRGPTFAPTWGQLCITSAGGVTQIATVDMQNYVTFYKLANGKLKLAGQHAVGFKKGAFPTAAKGVWLDSETFCVAGGDGIRLISVKQNRMSPWFMPKPT